MKGIEFKFLNPLFLRLHVPRQSVFQNILDDSVYIDFEAPLYKLRIGNYIERKKAREQ